MGPTEITFKRRINGVWADIPARLLGGMTVEEAVCSFDGTETVMRINMNGEIIFACGTKRLQELYQSRGDTAYLMQDVRNAVNGAEFAFPESFNEIFDQCTLQQVCINERG